MCPNFHAKSGMTLQSISLYHRSRDMKTTSFYFYTKHRSRIVPLEGTNCPLHRRKLGTNRPLPGHIWSLYFPAIPCAARLPDAESAESIESIYAKSKQSIGLLSTAFSVLAFPYHCAIHPHIQDMTFSSRGSAL